jgi:tetratricopeptide (TPR) repeat protein
MAKKNKKNKGSARPEASKRVESTPAVQASAQPKVEEAVKTEAAVARPQEAREDRRDERREDKRDEATSNVIQFPAQTKRTMTQVAVNADVVQGSDEAADEGRDETQPRLRTEDDKAEAKAEAVASERAKSEPPKAKSQSPEGDAARTEAAESDVAKSDLAKRDLAKRDLAKRDLAKRDEEDEDGTKGREARERRKKKSPMTESGQMRAIGTGEHARVTEEFFTAPRTAAAHDDDDFADLQRSLEPMSAQSKQWMWGSVGILLIGSVLIGAYWYYQNVHLPQPVPLGQAGPVEMPSLGPLPAAQSTAAAATTEARAEPAPTAVAVAPEAAAVEPEPATVESAAVEPAAVEPATVEPAAVEPAAVEPAAVGPTTVAVAPTPAPREPVAEPTPTPAPAGETYESVLAEATAARGAARQIPLLERAIALNPNGAEALARLSYLYVGRGGRANLEQARTYAERATAADPTNSQGWLVLGAARGELGDRVGARAAYESCVERGQGRFVSECRRMLR